MCRLIVKEESRGIRTIGCLLISGFLQGGDDCFLCKTTLGLKSFLILREQRHEELSVIDLEEGIVDFLSF